MCEAKLGGAFRFLVGELAKVIMKAIDTAAVEAGPEGGLTDAGATGSGHLDVVIRRPADHVTVRFDVAHCEKLREFELMVESWAMRPQESVEGRSTCGFAPLLRNRGGVCLGRR